jgi:hypothetical protein
MPLLSRFVVTFLAAAGSVALVAQASWLPPQVEQGLANQLAGRLTQVGAVAPADPLSPSERANKTVKDLGVYLGSLTDQGAFERAPVFTQIKVPVSGQLHLDAMARYQVCTLELFRRFETGTNPGSRRATALGLTAVTMAVIRLREPFIRAGGNDERIEGFLTGGPMNSLFEQLQAKPDLLAHVERQCEPVLRDLLDKTGR